MIGFALGLLYANAIEWANHRWVLHGLGRKKDSFWAFHWHEHHRNARRNGHLDPDYLRSRIGPHAQGKETLGMVVACLAHVPLFPIAPTFVAGAWTYAIGCWMVHKHAHLDPEWAKRWIPWHYDHHMGPDQDKNWGTALPWMDILAGTRKPYLGTERHERDRARAAERGAILP